MRLIINASTLSSTGVVQVAVSFINECINISDNEYLVLISPMIKSQININSYPSNFKFKIVNTNPNKIFSGIYIRFILKKIARNWRPDCVFTVFGPSYWTPKVPHLIGYAYPHYVYPESPIFSRISYINLIKINLYKIIHSFYFKKNGDYYVAETVDVMNRVVKYLGFKKENVYTVSNTFNKYFNEFKPLNLDLLLPKRTENEFRFLSLCSLSYHKNLEILNDVITLLNKEDYNIKFILTVDENDFQKKFTQDAKKKIINIGRIDVSVCPQLFYETDALFLPTLLECFTANYPEAFKMRKPIITSNLTFATSICQNAALYFNPIDPIDIKNKIIEIVSSIELRNKLINEGDEMLKNIPSAELRAQRYIEICKSISSIK